MSTLNVSLDQDKMNVADNEGRLMFSLPFNLNGYADADQWLRNFYRMVGYASANSGRKLSKKETVARANTILAIPEVKDSIERNYSFWEGRAVGTCQEWFYEKRIMERPVIVAPVPGNSDQTNNPNDKSKETGKRPGRSLTWLYILIAILLGIAAFFYFSADDEGVDVGATLEEQGEDAKQMVDRCVKIVGQPGVMLKNLMTEDDYFMVYYPFKSFVDKMVEQGGPAEAQTIHQAALSEMERSLIEWQARCNCELNINCAE